jgi:hypothetical protein
VNNTKKGIVVVMLALTFATVGIMAWDRGWILATDIELGPALVGGATALFAIGVWLIFVGVLKRE